MKIVIVIAKLSYGGAEHVGVLLANGLSLHGNEVVVASHVSDEFCYSLHDSVRLITIFSDNVSKLEKWIGATAKLKRIIKKEHPDIVIGIAETCSLISKIACIGMNTPVIYTAHNAFERPKTAPMGRWNKIAKFIIGRIYDGVTVLTEADKTVIGKQLSKVYVMPNPLELKQSVTTPKKKEILLAAGRLDAWHVKGFDVLIKAWGALMRDEEFRIENSGWRLQIAGTGGEESLNYLKRLCREYGVEPSVKFLGFQKDIEKLYKEASVFVLSSRYEGFGLVLIEAMSQGCACIACDYKGRQREIIQNETQGLCCEPDNEQDLANAIARMITDNHFRESVRQNAIERSKYYSLEKTVSRWEVLLNNIVNSKK